GGRVALFHLPCVDRSLTPRQDCFINFQFPVPSKVPPGEYTLRIQVRDDGGPAPRAAERSLDFKVTAAGSRGPAAPRGGPAGAERGAGGGVAACGRAPRDRGRGYGPVPP